MSEVKGKAVTKPVVSCSKGATRLAKHVAALRESGAGDPTLFGALDAAIAALHGLGKAQRLLKATA